MQNRSHLVSKPSMPAKAARFLVAGPRMLGRECIWLLPWLLLVSCDAMAGEPRWFKGNTHTHSLWSDGDDFPEMIADWYKREGYHFLVFSDHNTLSRGERWMEVAKIEARRATLGHSTLEKYRRRFGEPWVELRKTEKAVEVKVAPAGEQDEGEKTTESDSEGNPAPETRIEKVLVDEVRLRPLEEFRPLFEAPGRFLLMEGEEITDRFKEHEVHTNAIHLAELISPQGGESVRDVMRRNLLAVRDQAERLERPILAHLNHPNFRWSITAEDIAHVLEETFFEVYNGHPFINHLGDDTRPGDERIWDIANTLRLAELNGRPLYGLATDDSHHYHGGDVKPGRGWVMVRAEALTPEALLAAIESGDFYASTGVTLEQVAFDEESRRLTMSITPEAGVTYRTEIIGTLRGEEGDPQRVGSVLQTIAGEHVDYVLGGNEWYVRATVTSSKPHPRPSFEGQLEQAWTQPVGF